jgi:hypothetical protein
MRTGLAVLGMLLFLAVLMTANIHFARQENALRVEARRALVANRAAHEDYAGRHIVLDCVEIQQSK